LDRLRHFSDLIHRLVGSQRSVAHLGSATILIVANATMATLSLYIIAAAISGLHTLSFMGTGCIFIVSWLAGFATPGAPAGLGVRETVMLTLLSPTMPMSDAVAASLVFRIATTATDLSVFGLGFCIPSSGNRKGVLAP
jgi:uncharacterized membrane protein YbhN (UPF0104 family)